MDERLAAVWSTNPPISQPPAAGLSESTSEGNNPWLSAYQSHFKAMRDRGITYEQAQSHLSAGDYTWYLNPPQQAS